MRQSATGNTCEHLESVWPIKPPARMQSDFLPKGIKLNITDAKGRWRLTSGMVENRQTGKVRAITGIPAMPILDRMHEETFARKCKQAFETGVWP